MENYKIVNGTSYSEYTNDEIINIIEDALHSRKTRLRFAFGDTVSGKDWDEIYDICGYIGRSTGSIKIPLLINNSRSIGGCGLLDSCIVKIERKRQGEKAYSTAYVHPNYHRG